MAIDRSNVGRIAERIVANELENHGWRVSDLNRDGTSANADLIAAREGLIRQIQVKGATNTAKERWWFQYGHCTEAIIEGHEPVFNRKQSFYKAEFVVLVAVRTPTDYKCIVMPFAQAEAAAQINLHRGYRGLTRAGEKKKPGKIWIEYEASPRPSRRSDKDQDFLKKERSILKQYQDAWGMLLGKK